MFSPDEVFEQHKREVDNAIKNNLSLDALKTDLELVKDDYEEIVFKYEGLIEKVEEAIENEKS